MSTQKIKPLLVEFLTTYKLSTVFYLFFGVFWAFTLPYMAFLFGELVENLKQNGFNATPMSQSIGIPLGLYVSIHVLRSFGYYVDGLLSTKNILDFKKN